MARGGSSYHADLSGGPVNPWVILCQPRVSQDVVVLFPKVYHKEVLCCVPFIDPKMELDLMTDHSSRIVGPISISGIHGLAEFLQWPFHPLCHVEVNTTNCCPTVD